MELNIIGNWVANIVLVSIGYATRLVFGSDKLNVKQLIAFYSFCIAVLWIVDKLTISPTIKSCIILCAGLVIPNIIKGIIGGGNKSENIISKTIEKNVKNISQKVDKITDALTDTKKENDAE